MESRRGRVGRNRNVFKGSVLVSILLETHPHRFQNRAAAIKFAKHLFRERLIKSIFGSKTFDDSAQLYMWQDDDAVRCQNRAMTSSDAETKSQLARLSDKREDGDKATVQRGRAKQRREQSDAKLIKDVKSKVLNRSEAYNIVTSYNTFFQELQRDFGSETDHESERHQQCSRGAEDYYYQPIYHQENTSHKYIEPLYEGILLNNPYQAKSQQSTGIHHEPWESKRRSTCSTDSSVDTQTYFHIPERHSFKTPHLYATMTSTLPGVIEQHLSVPEERTSDSQNGLINRPDRNKLLPEASSFDYDMTSATHAQNTRKSHASTPSGEITLVGTGGVRKGVESNSVPRWPQETAVCSYSDNEKQLIEEMKRMKKEHEDILRTYEGRINKLMAKMHELRNIAEMLENSSSKSSLYGMLPSKATILSILASGQSVDDNGKKPNTVTSAGDCEVPPPLPPRHGRAGRIYPNKPIIHPRVHMKHLHWNRIILGEKGSEGNQNTVWHGMLEPKINAEELERLYCTSSNHVKDESTLLDDIYAIRGRPKYQLFSIFDAERSQRILTEMRNLHCTLNDVINAFTLMDCSHLHQDSFAELLELLNSPRDVDKIIHHVKRKGPGQLDAPEYLVFELSKIDHLRERLEYIRFKNKLQINLFEIDQQLRELGTACDELINNKALKNVLGTILSLGNYLNGRTERGQADGFHLDILNKLKECIDRTRRGNLLELVMRTYCLHYESDMEMSCPTRFRLPEPSNMRHAAQVSFEEIYKALRDLREELTQVKNRLEKLSKQESSNFAITLRVKRENFLTSAIEMLAEEKCFLEDVKSHFLKTAAYFFHDNKPPTPHEFFQIWATFLHDCKYYWKLAHRNLSKYKFEQDFSLKCQLSCSSLPGFSSLKNKMLRTVATLESDQEMRASKAQQLQHVNNWIESLGRYTEGLESDAVQTPLDNFGKSAADKTTTVTPIAHSFPNFKHQNQNRTGWLGIGPSSPKTITSTPPNVHKPQPVVHISPSTISYTNVSPSSFPQGHMVNDGHKSGSRGGHPNPPALQIDEDMSDEPYESFPAAAIQPCYEESRDNEKRDSQVTGHRINSNFSLKSWLKREQRQLNHTVEFTSADHSHHYPSQQVSKSTTTTPLNKLRNSVVHKLTSSGNSKKLSDAGKSAPMNGPDVPPKPLQHCENEFTPSHQILFHSNVHHSPNTEAKTVAHNRVEQHGNKVYQNYFNPSQSSKQNSNQEPNISTMASVTNHDFSQNNCGLEVENEVRLWERSRERPNNQDEGTASSSEFNLIHGKAGSHSDDLIHSRSDKTNIQSNDLISSKSGSQTDDLIHGKSNKANIQSNDLLSDKSDGLSNDMMHGKLSKTGSHNSEHSVRKGSHGRNRAPIALGSNLSITEVYDPVEETEKQTLTQLVSDPIHLKSSNYLVTTEARDTALCIHSSTTQPNIVESKRVKANPVPVYKAKLIPNYENQKKLDPRLEPGIRGQVEPVHQSNVAHIGQPSNSSEIYRQELQRMSELYVSPSIPFSQQQYNSAQQPSTSHSHSKSTSGSGALDFHFHHCETFQNSANCSVSMQNLDNASSTKLDTEDYRQRQMNFEHSRQTGLSFNYLAGIETLSNVSQSTPTVSSQTGDKILGPSRNTKVPRELFKERLHVVKTLDSSPAKVSALIHRWERQGAPEHVIPSLEGQDKPPSMTSTPVTRRKNPMASRGLTPDGNRESGFKNATMRSQSLPSRGHQQNFPSTDPHILATSHQQQKFPSTNPPTVATSGSTPNVHLVSSKPSSHLQVREVLSKSQHSSEIHQEQPQPQTRRSKARQVLQPVPQHSTTSHHDQQQAQSLQQTANHHESTHTYPPRIHNTQMHQTTMHTKNGDITDSSHSDCLRKMPHGDGEHESRKGNISDRGKPVPLPRHNVQGTMAVVKPTVMHKGSLTFMEI